MAITLSCQSVRAGLAVEGRESGSLGRSRGGLARMLAKWVIPGPEGWRAKGFFAKTFLMSRTGTTMISQWNGSFFAMAARRADALALLRAMNVPTAPMLTRSNVPNCFAIRAGWQRLALPTLIPRRNTTEGIGLEWIL